MSPVCERGALVVVVVAVVINGERERLRCVVVACVFFCVSVRDARTRERWLT